MYLLRLINRHLERTRMPETLFGRTVVNDPRFVSDLRNGREPGPRVTAKVCTYIADAQERGR
ncbi:hypothetical protein HL653_09620 [Sphingomonas sp. AP4-R1]|uniref:hypothetical protein n=1 Tax=Sphingomonas sp. AP4-R1 TaxID=2735134 RepID=UPI001493BE23|nr:hypothetical protein [Sphingomonas sp. AP4-R1]QJU58021.1 hypothetical protein HL653_09620 [Sphingomonas sp. AP4-R1]